MKQGIALDGAGLTSTLEGVVHEKPLWIRKKLITLPEAAEILSMSPQILFDWKYWKNDRKAGFFVKMGRSLRVDTEKLMKFIEKKRLKSTRLRV